MRNVVPDRVEITMTTGKRVWGMRNANACPTFVINPHDSPHFIKFDGAGLLVAIASGTKTAPPLFVTMTPA